MPFKKGNKVRGTRKGIPNRWTKEFKENVENCFNEIGDLPALVKWAKKNRDAYYTKLWAKLAPLQITGQVKVDHGNEFDGAAELFARLIAGRADAIRARRDHLKVIEGKASSDPAPLEVVGKGRSTSTG